MRVGTLRKASLVAHSSSPFGTAGVSPAGSWNAALGTKEREMDFAQEGGSAEMASGLKVSIGCIESSDAMPNDFLLGLLSN